VRGETRPNERTKTNKQKKKKKKKYFFSDANIVFATQLTHTKHCFVSREFAFAFDNGRTSRTRASELLSLRHKPTRDKRGLKIYKVVLICSCHENRITQYTKISFTLTIDIDLSVIEKVARILTTKVIFLQSTTNDEGEKEIPIHDASKSST
jgi:hypothetical protein